VTKVQWIPEVGLVSSSLDATIKTFDINRERITHTCSHHAKGVHSFVWCKAYSCFASCGLERDVTVWHVSGGKDSAAVKECTGCRGRRHTAVHADLKLPSQI
jgi:WD40 repeat protein